MGYLLEQDLGGDLSVLPDLVPRATDDVAVGAGEVRAGSQAGAAANSGGSDGGGLGGHGGAGLIITTSF